MPANFSPADTYRQYIQNLDPPLSLEALQQIDSILDATNWEEPETPIDLNNVAVVSLIEAEQASELSIRASYVELAIAALESGASEHPLCLAHLALAQWLIGERQHAIDLAFSGIVNLLQPSPTQGYDVQPGLVFTPNIQQPFTLHYLTEFPSILSAENGREQALQLLSAVLYRSPLVFYNSFGLRLLVLAHQFLPTSVAALVRLGISSLCNHQSEGLIYLHQAQQQQPKCGSAVQALYLAYRDLGQLEKAAYWLDYAHSVHQQQDDAAEWQWAKLPVESDSTYIPFANTLLLSAEPSFRSIVTSQLIATGDWFEAEMEWWRQWLKPGMTVIDVGANVGVYTFSAALQVGSEGRVLAVEPFSQCVRHLHETCQLNQLSWVKVCSGAASDRNGQIRFSIHTASELNEVIPDDAEVVPTSSYTEVPCFTLDSLVEQEHLTRVDIMKLDAEGHEISVLKGCSQILTNYKPMILYENIAAAQHDNLAVAEFLQDQGYQLYHYRPYVRELIPIVSNQDLHGKLNIIASAS
jgi:FkbM family methyltransferase